METERAKRLANFVSWVGANIKGDEKGEAQVFLERIKGMFLIALARCLVPQVKSVKSGVSSLKSGVSSSFLPEKMNRHRAKKLGRGG